MCAEDTQPAGSQLQLFTLLGLGLLGPRWKRLPVIGSDFPGIPSGAKPQKPVIANGLSFGVGKELPL